MKSARGFAPIILIIIVVVLAGAGWYLSTHSATTGMNRYSDSDAGFSFLYPKDSNVESPSKSTFSPHLVQSPVILISGSNKYMNGRFRVLVNGLSKTDVGCMPSGANTIVINDNTYVTYEIGDSGGSWKTYALVRGEKCFQIQTAMDGVRASSLDDTQLALFVADQKEVASVLEAIIQSFKFTK